MPGWRRSPAVVLTVALGLALAGCGDRPPRDPRATPSRDPDAPRVVVEMVTPSARAGEFVEAIVRLENVRGEGAMTVTFGDNGGGPGWAASDVGCGLQPGFRQEHRVRHAYRYAGEWTVTATFLSEICDGEPRKEYRGTAVARIDAAPVATNGPEQPRVINAAQHPRTSAPDMTRVQAYVQDPDGYLTEVRYAWGDGSADSVFTFPLSKCVDPPDHWPTSPPTESLDEAPWAGPEHRYADPGHYSVTVTAVTTGCDGGARQQATAAVEVVAGS